MAEQSSSPKEIFGFSYTRKDLILYALSIGLGSDDSSTEEDLRFLYERHPYFTSLPLFCLTLIFWSNRRGKSQTSDRLPAFPPPLMAKEQIIPQQFLRESLLDLSEFPIIHTWESITWDRSPPVPDDQATVDTVIDLETISVQPKSIGTFVTSQSTVRIPDNPSLLCTVQSTVVVLGISKDAVVPFDSGVPRQTANPPIIPEDCEPTLEWTYTPAQNQALLYRIASGDTNHIHVDTSVSEQVGNHCNAPLLHGLFTLAVAFRGILKLYPDADRAIRQLEAKFTQPAFVGDTLLVRLWNKGTYILFQVVNKDSEVVLVDCGCATFGDVRIHANAVTRSRL